MRVPPRPLGGYPPLRGRAMIGIILAELRPVYWRRLAWVRLEGGGHVLDQCPRLERMRTHGSQADASTRRPPVASRLFPVDCGVDRHHLLDSSRYRALGVDGLCDPRRGGDVVVASRPPAAVACACRMASQGHRWNHCSFRFPQLGSPHRETLVPCTGRRIHSAKLVGAEDMASVTCCVSVQSLLWETRQLLSRNRALPRSPSASGVPILLRVQGRETRQLRISGRTGGASLRPTLHRIRWLHLRKERQGVTTRLCQHARGNARTVRRLRSCARHAAKRRISISAPLRAASSAMSRVRCVIVLER